MTVFDGWTWQHLLVWAVIVAALTVSVRQQLNRAVQRAPRPVSRARRRGMRQVPRHAARSTVGRR